MKFMKLSRKRNMHPFKHRRNHLRRSNYSIVHYHPYWQWLNGLLYLIASNINQKFHVLSIHSEQNINQFDWCFHIQILRPHSFYSTIKNENILASMYWLCTRYPQRFHIFKIWFIWSFMNNKNQIKRKGLFGVWWKLLFRLHFHE